MRFLLTTDGKSEFFVRFLANRNKIVKHSYVTYFTAVAWPKMYVIFSVRNKKFLQRTGSQIYGSRIWLELRGQFFFYSEKKTASCSPTQRVSIH